MNSSPARRGRAEILVALGLALGCQATAGANTKFSSANPTRLPASATQDVIGTPTGASSHDSSGDGHGSPANSESAEPANSGGPSEDAHANSTVSADGRALRLPGNLVFDSGKATLSATAGNEAVLEELSRFLAQHPEVTLVRIEGHTDNVGLARANLQLSGKRALAVKQRLVALGVAPERLLAVGFGEQRPITVNSDAAGRALNRRTEFNIARSASHKSEEDPTAGGLEFQ